MSASSVELTALEATCCAYLALPIVLWLAFMAAAWIALAGVAGAALLAARMRIVPLRAASVSATRILVLALGAAALCMLTGIFPPLNMQGDWAARYAILNALVESDWPVVSANGQDVLRYYLGALLPPALGAKVLGAWALDALVFAWLWAGMFLLFAVLTDGLRAREAWISATIFVALGGADIVANLVLRSDVRIGDHLEWWAGFVSFTSHAAQLMWVPQHALPGWLGAALLMRRGGWTVRLAGPLLVAACWWSPFAALGLIPFFVLRALEDGTVGMAFSVENLLIAPVLGIPIAAFLLHGVDRLAAGPIWLAEGFSSARLLAFYFIEFLALAALLLSLRPRRPRWLALAVAVLILFPLYRLGHFNDFAMRATIPALAVLAIVTADTVSSVARVRTIPVVVLLLLGAMGPVSDLVGAASDRRRDHFKRGKLEEVIARRHPNERANWLAPYPHWTLR